MAQEAKWHKWSNRFIRGTNVAYCKSPIVAVHYKNKIRFIIEGMVFRAKRANQYGMMLEGFLYGNSRQIKRIYISNEVWKNNFACFVIPEVCTRCRLMEYTERAAKCYHECNNKKLTYPMLGCPRVRAENSQ